MPKFDFAASAALGANSQAQNSAHATNNYSGGTSVNGGTLALPRGEPQQRKADAAKNYSGTTSISGGTLVLPQGESPQGKADAGGANLSPREMMLPQAAPAQVSGVSSPAPLTKDGRGAPIVANTSQQSGSPAAVAAKRHVVFVLNVVDRLPPAPANR